jgi:hypothetical protein
MTPSRRRAASRKLTWSVIGLQAALLLTLAVTPTDPPSGSHLLQLVWAWMHRPTFYPLAALLVGGPVLSCIAWHTPGRHRAAIVTAWIVFLTVLLGVFGNRTVVMLQILWWHVNR